MSDAATATTRGALVLGGAVLAAVLALDVLDRLAAGRIEAARAARLASTLAEVLPDTPFDNDPASDVRLVDAAALGGDGPRSLYRARLGDRAVGAVLDVVAPDGYSGPIELLVGVRADGRVVAVRVVEHRETPGLGDRIERRRSNWIARFDGRAVDPADTRGWRIVRGGGRTGPTGRSDDAPGRDDASLDASEFHALSGATITSRAVVEAVHRALLWFETHRDEVFAS